MLLDCLDSLIAHDKALLLWSSHAQMAMTPQIWYSVCAVYDYLMKSDNPWAQPIGYIIPHEPHIISLRDASNNGGGAYCKCLQFWFNIIWSPCIKCRLKLKQTDPNFVHINCLEFIVVILQLAAVIVQL